MCRQALFVHRQALLEQLLEAEDPALVLHLTSIVLFQNTNHCMLHAPGRCVPHIIGLLESKIPTVPACLNTVKLFVKDPVQCTENASEQPAPQMVES